MDTPIIDNEPQGPGSTKRNHIVERGVEGNWKQLGAALNWRRIFRGRRDKIRRYMIDEGVSRVAINRVLGKNVPEQRVTEKRE